MQAKPHILIIDDDHGSNRTLALIFGRKGYETDTATSGQEALDKAREKTFNLALLDIKLPDIKGVTLIPSLKQLCPDIAVIIITGYASIDTAVQALDYGATAYLTKPLDMDAALITVKETLDKQLLVMEKKQAEIAMHRYIERLRTVHALDGAMLAAQTPEHIAATALRLVQELAPYRCGVVVTFDLENAQATLLAIQAEHDVHIQPGLRFTQKDTRAVQVLRMGQVYSESDLAATALPAPWQETLRAMGVQAAFAVPLLAGGQLIGALVLGGESAQTFTPEYIDIAREVADQLAIGIQQAYLREQVRQHTSELEQQVAARTADLTRRQVQLQVAAEVARDASGGSDLQVLITRAVDLICERFGFYHAGIFLIDRTSEYAILRAAAGEGGRRMLAAGHKLPVGKTGLVGYVTQTGKPRIANDTGVDAVHFNNPFLPETRSEMTLPLRTGERIIGALDVQSNKENAFDDDDIGILQVLADQLAVAIERTRLFEQMQTTLEKRLQMIISNLPVILCVLNRESVFTLSEGKGLTALGLKPDAVVGQSIEKVFPENVNFHDHIRHALAGETLTAKVKLSERVFESWYGPLWNDTGEVTGVTTVCIDVTEQQSLEAQIHRQERLAAVGQLAGGIAHDFNNFLTTIIMYAGLIQRTKRVPGEVIPLTKVIMDESRRASQLVRQVLDFSRRSMMEVEPVDLQSFVQEAVDILRKTLAENIELSLESPPGEYIVNADPTRIQQVLMNLALNARDAMPDGGKLRISLSRVHAIHTDSLSERKLGAASAAPDITAGEWLRLSIADTGTGMTETVRAHLFEPFFTTKGLKGTGLGLAQVYGIVKQHGGEVDVETELGRGTTFHIDLPVYQRESKPEEEAPTVALFVPEGHGETILLVEDEENVRGANLRALESMGYRVLAAANGLAALSLYEAANEGKGIDLVITDLMMPGMGGRELIQRLRVVNPAVKVVAVTGHVLREELAALREENRVEVIHKPLDINTLASVVNRILSSTPGLDGTFQ
jgi:PAS domain S-box-containing protein